MTELEEQFFKTFGILPIMVATSVYKYPEITAEILLELIVITTKYTNWIRTMNNIDDLKRATLEELIENADWTKNQVQKVFEGE